jgi:hypothetical protein
LSQEQETLLFFCFHFGMPISDHASEGLSRKAKRLDSPERRGTLAHAKVKASLSLSHPLIFPRFKLAVLGLDIEGLFNQDKRL